MIGALIGVGAGMLGVGIDMDSDPIGAVGRGAGDAMTAGRGGTLAEPAAGDDETDVIGASPRTSWTVRTTSSIPT